MQSIIKGKQSLSGLYKKKCTSKKNGAFPYEKNRNSGTPLKTKN